MVGELLVLIILIVIYTYTNWRPPMFTIIWKVNGIQRYLMRLSRPMLAIYSHFRANEKLIEFQRGPNGIILCRIEIDISIHIFFFSIK